MAQIAEVIKYESTKVKYKRKLRYFQKVYAEGKTNFEAIKQVLFSYRSHLSFGHTYKLQKKVLGEFVLTRENKAPLFAEGDTGAKA